MLLAIDAGNTNIVFAVMDHDGTIRAEWRAATDPRRTADEYAVWLTQLMGIRGLAPEQIDAAILASVVPAADFALRSLAERYFGCRPLVVGAPGFELGIAIRIDRPEQAGADRLVNAVAAHAKYPGALAVIDFGTATTFDIVGPDGSYEGGIIAPGVHLSVDALYMAAAKLPRIAVRRPERVIGGATVPAMESGVYWGYIGLIEGLVSRAEAEYGQKLTVIATGGLASTFMAATDRIHHFEPDLSLHGLFILYTRNS